MGDLSIREGMERRKERGEENESDDSVREKRKEEKTKRIIEGYPVEGLSIGGHETCIIFSSLNMAFDIGRCPQRAISQDFLFISHAHMDHIVSSFFSFNFSFSRKFLSI